MHYKYYLMASYHFVSILKLQFCFDFFSFPGGNGIGKEEEIRRRKTKEGRRRTKTPVSSPRFLNFCVFEKWDKENLMHYSK